MNFTKGEVKPYLPAFIKPYNPRISYSIGNRTIGLLFGPRIRSSMLWEMRTTVKDEVVLVDEVGIPNILGVIENIRSLSFVFDNFSYPIVAVETRISGVPKIEIYRFTNYGGESTDKVLIAEFPNCRAPKLLPSNVGDLGSITNQPFMLYIDSNGNVAKRSLKDNFQAVEYISSLTGLKATDELRNVGIASDGEYQIELTQLKETT